MATVSPLQNRGDIFIFMGLTDLLTIAKVLTQDVWSSHIYAILPLVSASHKIKGSCLACVVFRSVCLTFVVLGIHPRALSC